MAENVNETLIANAIGGGGGASDDIRKRLILAMLQEGTSGAPVAHFTQGLDRIAKAMLGGLELRDLDRSDRAHMAALTNMLTGGGGGPGVAPGGGRSVESGPRPSTAPPLAALPPMSVDPEPPRNPPLTNLTEQPDMDTARVAAAVGSTPLVPPGPLAPQPGGAGPQGDAARAMLAQGLGAGQRGAFGANAILPPTPPSDPTMALAPPAESAGAIPPPLAPPGPPAGGQRPLTPPAPTAPPAGAVPGTMPEQRRAMVQMMLHPRTPPAAKAMIAQQLNPKWETKTLPNGDIAAINERTNEVRIIHKGEPKPTDDSLNLKEFNDSLPPGQKRLTLPEFKALQEGTKTTAELRAKSEFTKAEQQPDRVQTSNVISQDINRTIDKINKSPGPTTGIVGSAISGIYQPSTDVAELLVGIKGNMAFDKLQKMREASPTGAALGAITLPEIQRLEAAQGSLMQRQGREQLIVNLRRLDAEVQKVIHGDAPSSGGTRSGGSQGGGWQDVGGGVRIRLKQ